MGINSMRKIIILLAVILFIPASLWAANPFIGIWSLNVTKTKADNPNAVPKSETLEIAFNQNNIKTTFDGLSSGGQVYHIETDGKWNGEDFPAEGHPNIIAFSINKIDTNSAEFMIKKKDGYIESWQAIVSKDGETMTSTGKGKVNGQEYSGFFVYEKQLALDKEDIEADIQAIKNIIMSWMDAVNKNDVKKMMLVFAEDATRIPPNGPPTIGKEAIRAYYQRMFKEATIKEKDVVKSVDVSCNLGIAHVIWSATVINSNREKANHSGNWLWIFKRMHGGKWLLSYSIWSNEK